MIIALSAHISIAVLVLPAAALGDDGEPDNGISLSMTWQTGNLGLVADYAELERLPAPAPGLRETTTRVRGMANLSLRSDVELDISAFGVVEEDESGRSSKGAGARVGLKFKM